MKDINVQTVNENNSLLILNDDCLMELFERLPLEDYVNLANTCWRLRVIAHTVSSRKHKKIEIDTSCKASDSKMLSKREFSEALSMIGEHVLEVEVHSSYTSMLKLVKEKCKNLKSIAVYGLIGPQVLQGFQNLKHLNVDRDYISINNWKNFSATNSELEVLDINGDYEDGFIEVLKQMPKLRSLSLPKLRLSLQQSPGFQHLFQLTGLTKLSLHSDDNLNWILVELAKSMSLVELDIYMKFDDKSLRIIKSFQHLEVLSIDAHGRWNEAWFSDATVFSPNLRRLKIKTIQISCSKFLEILEYLTSLEEFELGFSGDIYWDDESLFRYSKAIVAQAIENALIRNRRELKILQFIYTLNSLYFYRSNHLQIINTYALTRSRRRVYVDATS